MSSFSVSNYDLSGTQFTVGRCLGAAATLVLKGFCGGSKPPPYDRPFAKPQFIWSDKLHSQHGSRRQKVSKTAENGGCESKKSSNHRWKVTFVPEFLAVFGNISFKHK